MAKEKCFTQRKGLGWSFRRMLTSSLKYLRGFCRKRNIRAVAWDLPEAFPEKSESILSVPIYRGAEAWEEETELWVINEGAGWVKVAIE